MSSKLTKQVNMVSSMCSVRVQPRRGSVYVDIGVVRTPDSRGIVRVAVIPCRIGQRIVPIPSIHADIVTFQVPTANERSETYLLWHRTHIIMIGHLTIFLSMQIADKKILIDIGPKFYWVPSPPPHMTLRSRSRTFNVKVLRQSF